MSAILANELHFPHIFTHGKHGKPTLSVEKTSTDSEPFLCMKMVYRICESHTIDTVKVKVKENLPPISSLKTSL